MTPKERAVLLADLIEECPDMDRNTLVGQIEVTISQAIKQTNKAAAGKAAQFNNGIGKAVAKAILRGTDPLVEYPIKGRTRGAQFQ